MESWMSSPHRHSTAHPPPQSLKRTSPPPPSLHRAPGVGVRWSLLGIQGDSTGPGRIGFQVRSCRTARWNDGIVDGRWNDGKQEVHPPPSLHRTPTAPGTQSHVTTPHRHSTAHPSRECGGVSSAARMIPCTVANHTLSTENHHPQGVMETNRSTLHFASG